MLSAPSGCGKSTIVHALMGKRDKLRFSVSATTRAPRAGERDGVDYYFVSHEKFDEMIERGDFLEHAVFVSNSYGTPRAPVEKQLQDGYDVILEIDVQGAMQVKRSCPEAVTIFIMPPSTQELEKRLRLRGNNTEEDIVRRLAAAEKELEYSSSYDHSVINDDVSRAVEEISRIIDE